MSSYSPVGLLVCGGILVSCLNGNADTSPRAAIQRAYDKQIDAARYKYIPGMWSSRASDFQAFSKSGMPVDLRAESSEMSRLLDTAVSVTEKVSLLSFEQLGASRARCQVRDVMNFLQPGDKHRVLVLDCTSEDEWVLTHGRWQMRGSRVQKQTVIEKSAPVESTKP